MSSKYKDKCLCSLNIRFENYFFFSISKFSENTKKLYLKYIYLGKYQNHFLII